MRLVFIPLESLPPAPSLAGRSQTLLPVHFREGRGKSTTPPPPIETIKDGQDVQFEALLLEELEVEAIAMLELPVAATDLRMCGRR